MWTLGIIAVLLFVLAFLVVKHWYESEPSFIEPRVIATKKYEPKPYYPPEKKTDQDWKEVRERSEYQIIEEITP